MLKRCFSVSISILLILVFFGGCATTMSVNAIDPNGTPINGATVMVDGLNIGQTPDAATRESNFIGNNPSIRVVAEGFNPRTTEAAREFKVAPFIAGLFLWPLLLWVYGPRAEQNVILTPAQ